MKRKLALPAKLVRPAQAGAYRRPRLFALLDGARPVAWVSGPPGAGKTTLVASYVEARRIRPIWYQLDEGDSDAATLFYYLRLAAVRLAPRKRWRLPLLTPEYLSGLETFTRRWFEELFAELPRPFCLVFDNYHEIAGDSPLHGILRAALETLPQGGRAVILSRGEPPAGVARLRAEGKMALVDWDALQLTPTETAGIARSRTSGGISAKEANALHVATDGWAAGLVLMLERAGADQTRSVATGRLPQSLFDYFAAEILALSSAETRQVLLETSLLPKVTAVQAEALTGTARAGEILAELARRRYFTDAHSEREPTYQYHPLFREFLLTQAREQLPQKRRAELRRKAAMLLEQSGQVDDAAELLRKAEDWEALARIALANASALVASGRGATLGSWLRQLPQETLEASPWLLYWMGACRLPVNPRQGASYAELAYERFAAGADRTGIIAAASLGIDAILFEWGNLARLDPWIAALETSLAGDLAAIPDVLQAHATASLFAALIWRRPEHPDMAKWAARAESCFRASRDGAFRGRAGVSLGHYFMWAGEIDVADTIVEALNAAGAADTPVLTRLWSMVLEAHLAWIKADPDRCRRTVSRAMSIAATEGVRVVDAMLLQAGVYGELVAGNVAAARQSLARIRADIHESQLARLAQHHYLASWAAFLEGDLPAAHAQAEAGERVSTECGAFFGVMVCCLALAQTLYERGEHSAARNRLADALRRARLIRSRHVEQLCLLVEADFAFRENDPVAATARLQTAFELGRQHGFLAGGFWRRDLVARLCTRALAAGIEVEYARQLVRVHHLRPDPAQQSPAAWPWPVRICAFGRFEVHLDGEPVVFAGKAQRKPLALLKVMVAFGARSVSERDISDVLWPEAEGDAAHQALSVTLHRLRRLLRNEAAIRRQDGRLELDPQLVWSDVAAFESTLNRAAHAAPADRLRLVDAALQLYRGPLLGGDEDQGWTAALRERLRARLVREVQEAAHAVEATDPERAARCYLRALDVDDGAEDLYRRLIALYQRLGRRAEALAVYQRCQTALRFRVGVAPSPETEAIVRSLLAAD
jgi:ATP/maltotriose-dependent transcriptional regulator MalT/DNA-binding SARP family transcriptional activator